MSLLLQPISCPRSRWRSISRKPNAPKPGNLTHVGLGTFIDPRVDGGKTNELTKTQGEDIVTVINVKGRDFLFYHAFPIHVAFLRGTSADPDGNITMEKEAMVLDALSMAQAVRNSDGVVIVQVERIADRGTLPTPPHGDQGRPPEHPHGGSFQIPGGR